MMFDLNKEREALIAQIEEFKRDAMELWFVPDLAESYKNMDMFSYSIVENNEVFFMREQARQLWSFWNKAKAQAVPEGYVLMPKVPTEKMFQAYERSSVAPMSTLSKTGYKAMVEAAGDQNENS
ncbi:hypothetical protein A1D06_04280 [Acinetobacter baumannii]|uniref:hypothetical protein n=1 Tax=Acinetobacter baumannii TaxID=470 RepID=UPI00070755EA|nr:hypothetical protein AQ482_14010 [Acinetobacter baumannii]OFD28843.1 hypothetical protein A1D06_04280 [Acinetobacter baumannii]